MSLEKTKRHVFQYYKEKATFDEQTSEDFQQDFLKSFLQGLSFQPYFSTWKVLDFGSGIGNNLPTLTQFFSQIETADINPKTVSLLKKNFPQLSHHLLKTNTLPFSSESYDLIVATEVLEHIPDYAQIINQFYRLLRLKGYLIISTPNYFNLAGVVKWYQDKKNNRRSWSPWGVHQQGWEEPMTFWKLQKVLRKKFKIKQLRGADLHLAWFFVFPCFPQWLRHFLIYLPFKIPLLGKISMHTYILAQKNES